jgi:hypothetical protein
VLLGPEKLAGARVRALQGRLRHTCSKIEQDLTAGHAGDDRFPAADASVMTKAGGGSNGLFQFLCRPERDLLAWCNLQRLARGRVASSASLTLAHLKCAKAAYPDTVPCLRWLVTLSTIPVSSS